MTKRAAAFANHRLGKIDETRYLAITAACDELIANRQDVAFPLDMIQGGAGTSFNINANEVIANLANMQLALSQGKTGYIHPNDHVNI